MESPVTLNLFQPEPRGARSPTPGCGPDGPQGEVEKGSLEQLVERGSGTPCPVTHTLTTMSGKWTLLVVHQLLTGTKRFTEIRRGLAGVNPRTLAERLRSLEADGIVTREVFAEVPPRVQYTLTERGRSLAPVLMAMADWGERDLRR